MIAQLVVRQEMPSQGRHFTISTMKVKLSFVEEMSLIERGA